VNWFNDRGVLYPTDVAHLYECLDNKHVHAVAALANEHVEVSRASRATGKERGQKDAIALAFDDASRACALDLLGNPIISLTLCDAAVASAPQVSWVWLVKSIVLARLGRSDESVACCHQAALRAFDGDCRHPSGEASSVLIFLWYDKLSTLTGATNPICVVNAESERDAAAPTIALHVDFAHVRFLLQEEFPQIAAEFAVEMFTLPVGRSLLALLADDEVTAICVGTKSEVFVGSRGGGLLALTPMGGARLDVPSSGEQRFNVWDMAAGPGREIWAALGSHGILSIRGQAIAQYRSEDVFGRSYASAHRVVADSIGSIWAASDNCGLARFDGERWISYSKEANDVPSNHIGAVGQDRLNNVWFTWGTWTEDQGVSMYDGERWLHFERLLDHESDRSDDRIITGTDNEVVLVTNSQILVWHGAEWERMRIPLTSTMRKTNQRLAPLAYQGRRYSEDKEEAIPEVTDVKRDREGNIAIALTCGLLARRACTSKWVEIPLHVLGLGFAGVNCLLPGEKGGWWVGTREGLIWLADMEERHGAKAVSAPREDRDVTAIGCDLDGRVWAGTRRGSVGRVECFKWGNSGF